LNIEKMKIERNEIKNKKTIFNDSIMNKPDGLFASLNEVALFVVAPNEIVSTFICLSWHLLNETNQYRLDELPP